MKCYIKDEDAISLSIQQLACLNHSCWTILIISTSLKNLNQHANHQVDLCSFESFCAFDSCSTDLGECTRQVQRLISFIVVTRFLMAMTPLRLAMETSTYGDEPIMMIEKQHRHANPILTTTEYKCTDLDKYNNGLTMSKEMCTV